MLANESVIEKLDINSKDGMIFAGDDRAILISTQAFGILQRDLIENIGLERMKSFLFRHGWNLGEQDGDIALARLDLSLEKKVKYGPVLHSQKGVATAKMTSLEIVGTPPNVESFHMEGTWENSYEAIEHIKNFGLSEASICYTLTGYASGYISKLIGKKVIFKEQECMATGAKVCSWVGKLASQWGKDADQQLYYCRELPILRELETAHEKLLKERDNISKVTLVHKLLTEEIIKGNGLESIARVMYEQTGIPVLIEDRHHQRLAYEGIEPDILDQLQHELFDYTGMNNTEERSVFLKTMTVETKLAHRLISPILLHGKIIGYCSFLFEKEQTIYPDIHVMFIERVCSVCSLFLLNEKVKHDSEERMKGRFLDEILNQRYSNKKDILKRAAVIQLDLSRSYTMIAIDYESSKVNFELELSMHGKILETTTEFFKKEKRSALVGDRASHLIVLLADVGESTVVVIDRLMEKLRKTYSRARFRMGMGMRSDNILEANEAYKEAIIALRMASFNDSVVTFESLGIVGILMNSNNEEAVDKIAKSKLGGLYTEQNTDLLKTLYVFLLNGGNLEQSAEELALSISGLRYRMTKINKILGNYVRTAEENFQLLLSLKVLLLNDNLKI